MAAWRLGASALLVCLAAGEALGASGATVRVKVQNAQQAAVVGRRVQLLPQGSWATTNGLVSPEPPVQVTDTNGFAWFSNMLAATYLVDLGLGPKWPIAVPETNGVVAAEAILTVSALPPGNAAQVYSMAASDARFATLAGVSNLLSSLYLTPEEASNMVAAAMSGYPTRPETTNVVAAALVTYRQEETNRLVDGVWLTNAVQAALASPSWSGLTTFPAGSVVDLGGVTLSNTAFGLEWWQNGVRILESSYSDWRLSDGTVSNLTFGPVVGSELPGPRRLFTGGQVSNTVEWAVTNLEAGLAGKVGESAGVASNLTLYVDGLAALEGRTLFDGAGLASVDFGTRVLYGTWGLTNLALDYLEQRQVSWVDLPVSGFALGGGSQAPQLVTVNTGAGLQLYGWDTSDSASGNLQVQHSVAWTNSSISNVVIVLHNHWCPTNAVGGSGTNVTWELRWEFTPPLSGPIAAGTNVVTVGLTDGTPAGFHEITELLRYTNATPALSAELRWKLMRVASASNDVPNRVGLMFVDAHMPTDRLGSRSELSR